MDLWEKLETIIPVGEASADAAAVRKRAKETTGDMRSVYHMDLYRFYNTEAVKRTLLSPLFRHIAKRHLCQAIRSAEYYPDPLAMRAGELGKEGDYWEAAKEWDEIIPRQRAWMDAFKDPDGSRQLQLCTYLATAGAARSVLAQFDQSLFRYMEALKEFNQLTLEVRAGQASLEDIALAGIVRSLLALFRYEDALAFIEHALEGEMFSAYQSEVRHEFRVQREILPEVVKLTSGYKFTEAGLGLWATLMEEVQRCKSPEEAREIRRKIFDRIDRHESAKQIRDLEDAMVKLLNRDSGSSAMSQSLNASSPPPPDFSAITDPEWRKALEDAERRRKDTGELIKRINEAMAALNQIAIAQVKRTASAIYRVPRWFRAQWTLRAVARLAVMFLAIEFLIGKVLEKLLESNSPSIFERLHFSVSEGIITAAVALLLFLLSIPAERKIDEAFLVSYKRLLQKLVADRVTTYWLTYNTLLKTFVAAKAEVDKLKTGLQMPGECNPPGQGEKAF